MGRIRSHPVIIAISLLAAGSLAFGLATRSSAETRTPTFETIDLASLTERQIHDLFEQRVDSCMDVRDVRYEQKPFQEVAETDELSLVNGATYSERDFVDQFGFGVAENALLMVRGKADMLAPNALVDESAEYQEALVGKPGVTLGCRAVVAASFYDSGSGDRVSSDVIFDRAVNDARVINSLESWRACMSRNGYDAPDPDALIQGFEDDLDRTLHEAGARAQRGETSDADGWLRERLNEQRTREVSAAKTELSCGGPQLRAILNAVMDEISKGE